MTLTASSTRIAFLDKDTLDALQEYWFIVAKPPKRSREPFGVFILFSSRRGSSQSCHVYVEYTRFPPAIERVLARLVSLRLGW